MPIYHDAAGTRLPDAGRGEIRHYLASEALGSAETLVHENVLLPGVEVKMHRHAVEEVIVCTAGAAEVKLGEADYQPFAAGSVLIIPRGVPHTIRNTGDEPLRQLCFFPALTSGATWLEPDQYDGPYLGGPASAPDADPA